MIMFKIKKILAGVIHSTPKRIWSQALSVCMYIRVNYCNHTQTGPNSVIFSHTSFRFCMLVKLNNTYKYRVVNIIRDKAINVVEGGGMHMGYTNV